MFYNDQIKTQKVSQINFKTKSQNGGGDIHWGLRRFFLVIIIINDIVIIYFTD